MPWDCLATSEAVVSACNFHVAVVRCLVSFLAWRILSWAEIFKNIPQGHRRHRISLKSSFLVRSNAVITLIGFGNHFELELLVKLLLAVLTCAVLSFYPPFLRHQDKVSTKSCVHAATTAEQEDSKPTIIVLKEARGPKEEKKGGMTA